MPKKIILVLVGLSVNFKLYTGIHQNSILLKKRIYNAEALLTKYTI